MTDRRGRAGAGPLLLTVSDVQKIRVDRARVNHETYKQLYRVVHDRIKRRAAASATHLTYAIPPFVPGRPVYAPLHAARYITDKLRRGGFEVSAAGETLFVDWTPRPRAPPRPHREPPPPPPHHDSSGSSSGGRQARAPAAAAPAVTREAVARRLEALKRLI